jgi:hypothetical protein
MNATATSNPIETARRLGTEDGQTKAIEGQQDGSYRAGSSSDWDSDLINSIGNRKARELFGLEGDADSADDEIYSEALAAYNATAIAAYDAA